MDSTSIGANGSNGDGQGNGPLTFARADQMYVSLKRLHETGVLTAEAFDEQLKQLMVKDSLGRWWSKSRDTGDWFYYDGKDWVGGVPPLETSNETLVLPTPEPPVVATDGGTLDLPPNPALETTTTAELGELGEKDLGKKNSGQSSFGPTKFGQLNVTTDPLPVPSPFSEPSPNPVPYLPPLADPGPRTVAWLIDFGIVFIANIVLSIVGAGALTLVTSIAYFVYYWSTTGQTLGMKAQNIRVVREDGQPMSWETGAVRYVGYFLGSLCVLLGLLWVYWDPKRQGWHDKMAKTLVVRSIQ